jgi:hypothetical protein
LHFGSVLVESVLVDAQAAWIFARRARTFVSSFARRAATLVTTSTQRCGVPFAFEPQCFAKRVR